MKLVARSFAWLLPVLLCACAHNVKQATLQPLAPPIEDAPPPPDLAPTALPQPAVVIPKTKEPVAVPPEPPPPAPRRHKTRQPGPGGPIAAPAPQPSQVASESAPPEVSALGKIETPDTPDSKKLAENSIEDIEKGLGSIGRKLTEADEKTSMQIREFLKQARAALASGDLEGARTLTSKAKALLGELSQ